MGGNGTASILGYVENKEYKSLGTYEDPVFGEIKIIEWTGSKNKNPVESNSAPRIYMTFDKGGKGLNEIAMYGEDHKKVWSVHNARHSDDVPGAHYHEWYTDSNGNAKPKEPKNLTPSDPRYGLLQRVKDKYELNNG